MGNGIGKVCLCSSGAGDISRRYEKSALPSNQYDKSLGNSIFYIRPDPFRFSSCSNIFSDDDSTQMTFRSISGASVSANSSTPPSIYLTDFLQQRSGLDSAASFESSTSFTSVPLQPPPRGSSEGSSGTVWSPIDRWFSSSPIVGCGFVSSPFDHRLNSSSVEKYSDSVKLQRSLSNNGYGFSIKPNKPSLKKIFRRAISSTISRGHRSIVAPIKGVVSIRASISENKNENANATHLRGDLSLNDVEDDNYQDDGGGGDSLMEIENLHWAQGRAGEDRIHIVISEDHDWVFVGIYDGFNGPDATEYLLNNLFNAVLNEMKEFLCNGNSESKDTSVMAKSSSFIDMDTTELEEKMVCAVKGNDACSCSSLSGKGGRKQCEGREMRGKSEWDSEKGGRSDVLQALSEALKKTEEEYLKNADDMITKNAVLAMMGSCVLVMLMKGDDVYFMNVGDSRAVLAQTAENDLGLWKKYHELSRFSYLNSLQLTMDHNTQVKEEVQRIRSEHPDDPSAIIKGRVKGSLNVTRAFGVGFLKQPKHNNAVLETFRVNYIGNSPYITCSPSLHHHRLSPSDRFLILSSDGLFQYFSNEEAVSKVESFITSFPDRDPAQLLIEEALSRAAQKAGMDFHELLDIPQGERRLFHDDISIVIISLEGKIWRSSL